MNKKLILIAFSVVMFSTVGFAQKVITDKNSGAVIIDLSEMNPKFYTEVKIKATTTATNNTLAKDPYNDISENDLIYKKFEVHKTENHAGIDWLGAINLCANLDSNGKGWRLPRNRELFLISLLHSKLVAKGVSPMKNCWSATRNNTIYACVVYGGGSANGNNNTLKTSPTSVRCIRDLD